MADVQRDDAWAVDADRKRAWHISTGRGRTVLLSVRTVAEIVRGADPRPLLAAEIGPRTLQALAEYEVRRG